MPQNEQCEQIKMQMHIAFLYVSVDIVLPVFRQTKVEYINYNKYI